MIGILYKEESGMFKKMLIAVCFVVGICIFGGGSL